MFVFYFILQRYCPTEISPMGNLGCFPWGKPAVTVALPAYGACWVFCCFHNPLKSDTDHRIFNVHTDVNGCRCTHGCTDALREFALKVDSGRKIPCRNGESHLPQRHASPTLYQLSYISTSMDVHVLLRP